MNESLVILITRFRKEVHCTSVQKLSKSDHADNRIGCRRARVGCPPQRSFLRAFTFRPHQMEAARNVTLPCSAKRNGIGVARKTHRCEHEHVVIVSRPARHVSPGLSIPVDGFIGPWSLDRHCLVASPRVSGEPRGPAVQSLGWCHL